MLKAYKYQLDLNVAQQAFFNKSFGCYRFIYNWALQKRKEAYEKYKIQLSYRNLAKMLTQLKKEAEYSWLNEVSNECLQLAIHNMDTAFKNLFKYKSGFPKFKSKHNRQAIKNINCINVNLPGSRLKVQKSEWLKFFKDREFEGKINSIVISRNTCNKYFASVLVYSKKPLPITSQVTEQSAIGIDVGIKDFAVLSNGKRISNPKYLEVFQSRLAYYKHRLSRKQRGSNRRKAARFRVAKIHYKIANQRNQFLHKESSKIVRENQMVIIEDLNVKGMMQYHKLAKSIGSASWASFYNMLRYKWAWSGKNFIKIGRYEASTKTCHACQSKNEIIGLKDRQWICPNCNAIHDRDHNAAINIKNFGLKQYFSKKTGEVIAKEDVETAVYGINEASSQKA